MSTALSWPVCGRPIHPGACFHSDLQHDQARSVWPGSNLNVPGWNLQEFASLVVRSKGLLHRRQDDISLSTCVLIVIVGSGKTNDSGPGFFDSMYISSRVICELALPSAVKS